MTYAAYHAQCWAEHKTADEIKAEIGRVMHKAQTYHYKANEVGNATMDWQRVDALATILKTDWRHSWDVS